MRAAQFTARSANSRGLARNSCRLRQFIRSPVPSRPAGHIAPRPRGISHAKRISRPPKPSPNELRKPPFRIIRRPPESRRAVLSGKEGAVRFPFSFLAGVQEKQCGENGLHDCCINIGRVYRGCTPFSFFRVVGRHIFLHNSAPPFLFTPPILIFRRFSACKTPRVVLKYERKRKNHSHFLHKKPKKPPTQQKNRLCFYRRFFSFFVFARFRPPPPTFIPRVEQISFSGKEETLCKNEPRQRRRQRPSSFSLRC